MKVLLILVFGFLNLASFPQEGQLSDVITSIAEELADDETDAEGAATYIERLYDLIEKPVNLNSADETEISRLFFLTEFQIKALADYIKTSGKIVSVFEIANIPGFGREQAQMTIPFVTIEPENEQAGSKRMRNTLLTNFSARYPPAESETTGSPWKLLARYKFTAGKFSGGVTSEKDNGERLLSGKPPLPDFLSANISWNGTGIVRKVIAGDFGGRFGLGTNVNTGLRNGLSLTASGYLSGGDDIKPYTSTDENNFFRGAAVRFQLKKTGISLFYSFNKIDASSDTTDVLADNHIDTFYRTGLHSTSSMMSRKDAVNENFYGANVTSDFRNIRIGLLWTGCSFSLPVNPGTMGPEDIHDFTGKDYNTGTLYYKSVFGKTILFGEASASIRKKLAFVQGISFRPSDRLNINILYRNYDPGYISYHGKGPFSSSAGDNVKGVFANFTFEAAKYLFISAGCDLRYYPWFKYRCSAPSFAKSSEVRIKYLPPEKLTVEASYNYRFTVLNDAESTGIKKQNETVSRTFKTVLKYSINDQVRFGTRIDCRLTEPSGSSGLLLLQDFNFRLKIIPLSLWFRYCIFHIDNWDSRIYTYENDLLNSFSIPAMSGTGSRSYLMAEWSFGKLAGLRIKYAITELIKISETTAETEELKLQLRLWF